MHLTFAKGKQQILYHMLLNNDDLLRDKSGWSALVQHHCNSILHSLCPPLKLCEKNQIRMNRKKNKTACSRRDYHEGHKSLFQECCLQRSVVNSMIVFPFIWFILKYLELLKKLMLSCRWGQRKSWRSQTYRAWGVCIISCLIYMIFLLNVCKAIIICYSNVENKRFETFLSGFFK